MPTFTGTAGNDVLIGTPGDDSLDGQGGADTLIGAGGNDVLIGGPGQANEMQGGTGDDIYIVSVSGDTTYELAGEGTDSVQTALNIYGLRVHVENLIFTGAGDFFGTGNDGSNFILAGSSSDYLDGGLGADVLVGGQGNDILVGGSGATNELIGGTGNDTYFVSVAGDSIVELAGEGNDTVRTSLGFYVLRTDLENLFYTGSGDFIGVGNDAANTLVGGAGNDFLDGGLGADSLVGGDGNDRLTGGSGALNTLIGGLGDDIYVISTTGDSIVDYAGEGNDTVQTAHTFYTLGANLENLYYTGTGDFNGVGNNAANILFGGVGNDILNGGLGADTLAGGDGNDILIGGAGASNEMIGGKGNDTYIVSVAGDSAIEAAGEGIDTIQTALASFVLGNELENLYFTGSGNFIGTGNALANLIIGGSGNDVLDGGLGSDSLIGGAGNDHLLGGSGVANELIGGLGDDTYTVSASGDSAVEAAGEGNDTVRANVASFTLGANVENLFFVGTGNFSGTGNALANTFVGGAGSDSFTGLGGADYFFISSPLGASNVDAITDFEIGVDKIILAGGAGEPFAILASGTLLAGINDPYAGAALPAGQSVALDLNGYILYTKSTGAVYFDADGAGAGAAVQFATVTSGLSLKSTDFVVSGPPNNAPTITSGATASVVENSPASTVVYQATGSDADGDRFTWSLSGTDANLLTIDSNGAVRLKSSPDYEIKTSYSFNVVAGDSGSATTKAVTLSVTDVSDSPATPIINETSAPNDATGQAQVISRGTMIAATNSNLFEDDYPSATIVGSVSTPGDKDFFSITLQAGELLVLDVDGTSGGLDSFLTLYGPNLQIIGDNDDLISFDPGSTPPFGHNTDSQIRFRAGSTGTYYFSIESFSDAQGPTSSGGYQLHVSVGPQATPQQVSQEDVDALVSGSSWNHNNLTYGFPTSAAQYPTSFTEPDDGFAPFTATQQAATRLLLQLIGNVTPLTFSELIQNPGQADLRYAMSNEPEAAHAYYPTNGGPNSLGGTAWFNHQDFNNPVRGGYAWMGILHETGHALGLKHGHEFPLAISADRDSTEFTVMTYRSYPGDNISGYNNETWGYPQTLMMLDIAALQKIYGANFGFNAGNSVYTWSSSTGEMSINGVGQGAPGNGIGGSANRVFMTIWDGGGADTYDMSNYSAALTIDLRPGEWSKLDPVQLANLGSGNMARGNVANALLYQGNPASLIENAIGGSGNDAIYANLAANQLTGNGGVDTFRWASAADGGTGLLADTIADFLRGTDKIDLSGVDAIAGTAGNDSFSFIGTDAFHGVAGELRYEVVGGSANVFADTDGNGVADLQIVVTNITTLAGSDFVF